MWKGVHIDCTIDHEDWFGTRHDWLGLCPTIPNLGYATGFILGHFTRKLLSFAVTRHFVATHQPPPI